MVDANWLVDPSRRGTATGVEQIYRARQEGLRTLGEKLATIAALPVHAETASQWRAMNSLKHVKPMVWIDEVPWHEMDVDDELRLQTTSEWSRYHEWEMRKLIYQWEHMAADMVVEPVVHSPWWSTTRPSASPRTWIVAKTDEANTVVSRHFKIQISDEDDLEKIKSCGDPRQRRVRAALPAVERDLERIIEVDKLGANGFCFWFAPWDEISVVGRPGA